jgi:acyl carrier protein
LGRIDNQVKIRGFRIELGEIEAVLATHPVVQENVVIVHKSSSDKRLVSYLVPNDGQLIDNTELRTFLKDRLPDYMIPSAFITLESLPLTPNGKIDRRTLSQLSVNSYQLSEEQFVAPRTPEEELLVGIWVELLGIERVGVQDNFFELGGHSLLATQVMSRIRDTFEVELPLRELFESPTIAGLNLNDKIHAARQQSRLPKITPINRSESLPLSFSQQRLWFLNQLEGPSATYNIPVALRLEGTLHQNALAQSLQALVERHESLRTVFPTVNGTPVLQLESEILELSVIRLQDLPSSEQEIEIQKLINEDAQKPFDLGKGPLFRTTLFRLDSHSHVLLLNMHHIISDGWSLGVFIRELGILYDAFSNDKPSPLAPLPIQYVDFAHWQRQWISGEVLEKQLNYWKQQIAGAPPLLELPTDWPRPSVQRFRGATKPLQITSELTEQLKTLSQHTGTTLFMTLLSVFATLLSRYTGSDDIIIGSPIANRTNSQIESLIGFFVNTLVLRIDLNGNPRFDELLRRVRRIAIDAYAHQDIPFEQVVEELQAERNLSYSPLFQVMFVLQNAPTDALQLSELTITPIVPENVTAKFADLMPLTGLSVLSCDSVVLKVSKQTTCA